MNTHEHICIGMYLYHSLLKWGWNKVGCFVNWTEIYLYKIKGKWSFITFYIIYVCYGRCNAAVRLEYLSTPASQQACHSSYWWYKRKDRQRLGQFTSQAKILLARNFFTGETVPTQVCAVAHNNPTYCAATEKTKCNTVCFFWHVYVLPLAWIF